MYPLSASKVADMRAGAHPLSHYDASEEYNRYQCWHIPCIDGESVYMEIIRGVEHSVSWLVRKEIRLVRYMLDSHVEQSCT